MAIADHLSYDRTGRGYATGRRTDPRIAGLIWTALGDARTVLNVGAGTGSYEPPGREVVATEPSAVMRAQRPAGSAPYVAGHAEALPISTPVQDAEAVDEVEALLERGERERVHPPVLNGRAEQAMDGPEALTALQPNAPPRRDPQPILLVVHATTRSAPRRSARKAIEVVEAADHRARGSRRSPRGEPRRGSDGRARCR
ncbi:MAG: hypothetical protein ACXVH3_34175, partial [Solirubrobacteraceae bacterium]